MAEVGSREAGFRSIGLRGVVAHLWRRIVHGTTAGLVNRIHISVCDSLDILLVDDSRPGAAHVHYLGNNDRPEDGKQSTVTQAVCAKDPEGVLCLCT